MRRSIAGLLEMYEVMKTAVASQPIQSFFIRHSPLEEKRSWRWSANRCGLFPIPEARSLAIRTARGSWTRASRRRLRESESAHSVRRRKDGPLGDLGDVLVFRDGNGQAFAAVDVQHDVNVGAAVAHIDDAVVADLQLRGQLFKNRDFAVAGGDPFNGLRLRPWIRRSEDGCRKYDRRGRFLRARIGSLPRARRRSRRRKI